MFELKLHNETRKKNFDVNRGITVSRFNNKNERYLIAKQNYHEPAAS
jgi:hypothetical protein